MIKENDLCREAAKTAIEKHTHIVSLLKDIVTLNYSKFKVVDNDGAEIKDVSNTEFILLNIKRKAEIVEAELADLETCYKQMDVFNTKK